MLMIVTAKVIAAAATATVKHEYIVEQLKKLFTKLSTDPTTASELVEKKQIFCLCLLLVCLWMRHLS